MRGPQRFLLADCFGLSGWHAPEWSDVHGAYRWTGPDACSSLRLPIRPRSGQVLRIVVVHQACPAALVGAAIRINGHLLDASAANGCHGTTVLSGRLTDAHVSDPDLGVEISVGATEAPSAADARRVGIAVSSLEVLDTAGASAPDEPGRMDVPVSVVIACTGSWEDVRSAIACVAAVALPPGSEVIVASSHAAPADLPVAGGRALRWLCAPDSSVFDLRARGADAAAGRVVVMTEDHCRPDAEWAAHLARMFDEHGECVVTGCAVANGASVLAVDRASYAVTFDTFRPDRLTSTVPAIAGLAIRRDCLPRAQPPGWMEMTFVPAMQRLPHAVQMCRDAVTVHVQSLGWRGSVAAHYHNGRSARGFTSQSGRRVSVLRAAGESARMAAGNLRRLLGRDSLALQAWIVVLVTAHAMGVAVGAVAGVGRSAHRVP